MRVLVAAKRLRVVELAVAVVAGEGFHRCVLVVGARDRRRLQAQVQADAIKLRHLLALHGLNKGFFCVFLCSEKCQGRRERATLEYIDRVI